jgi:hypothetical protein
VATLFEIAIGVVIQFVGDAASISGNINDISNAMIAAFDPDAPKEPWVCIYMCTSITATK